MNKMKKEYKLKIKDNQGTWNVTFEAKIKGSRIKRALIQTLWDSEPLTVKRLVTELCSINKVLSNIVTHQKISNIIRGEKLFESVDLVSVPHTYYVSSYKTLTYKLNKDYLKGCELINGDIQKYV